MPGRKSLRRLQFGRETTPGTAVPATARMRFNGGMLESQPDVIFPPEFSGIIGGTDRSFIASIAGALSLDETPVTPEQLPYLLAMLYGGPFAGTADGTGGTGFRYVTSIPTTAVPTNTTYTIEGGDDYEQERMDYCKCVSLTMKGSSKAACTLTASIIGQEVARLGTGFSATTLSDINDLLFAGARLFLDPVATAIGTTQITNQFLGFEITFEAMWVPKFSGEGSTTGPLWSFVVFTDKKVTGKLTMEHDPAVDGNTGIKSLLRTKVPRGMRIDVLGQAYTTGGTGPLFTGGRRGLRIDLPIMFTKVPALEDMEGNSIVTVEFESRYNGTLGTAGSVTVCNEVSTLP